MFNHPPAQTNATATQATKRAASSARGAQILVVGFALIILMGTLLLKLPQATENPAEFSWLAALFTATSATTVTGLAVVPTAATFTLFGELVILGLIQIGGIGFVVLSVLLLWLIGRRVGLFERGLAQQTLGVGVRQGVVGLTRTVVIGVLLIELGGALLLFSQWNAVMPRHEAIYFSIFHAISTFCNAGFDLFSDLDDPYLTYSRRNTVILLTFCLLITLGTLGITVIDDLIRWPRLRRLSLHTRLVLPFTLLLTLIGTLLLLVDEWFVDGHAIAALPPDEQWLVSLFTIVSSRTAGVTLIPMDELGEATQLLILMWMFIGGAPASMGGGVGLTTIAVLLVTLRNTARGYDDGRVAQRTLPFETIFKAIAILTISTLLVFFVTLLLMLFDEGALFPVLFEVVSAFSNTGYSLGITSEFSPLGQLLLILTMFWGRLGPLTLVVALTQRTQRSLIRYPEERIILG